MPFMPAITTDVTDSAAGTNTATGCSFPVASGRMYWFHFRVPYTITDIADGSQWILDVPGSPTFLAVKQIIPTSTTTDTILYTATDSAEGSVTSSAVAAGQFVEVKGFCRPSAAGEVSLLTDSEGTADVVVKAGAFVEYRDLAA